MFDDAQLNKLMVKPFFKNETENYETEIVNENGEVTGWEVESRKRSIQDDKPVHLAAAILQHSKVLLLE